MNLGHLIATLGVDTAGLEAARTRMRAFEAQAQASITRVNATLKTVGTAMKKFGRMASMYLTLPLTLVGGAAFKMHKDFESSMTKIIGLVGVARAQVEQWGRDILRMAPELGKAPTELADALYFITSAGIRGAEAMEVLEMSAKASAVGLGETKVVADLVTSAMNAYGKANLSAAQATDILGTAVKEGKAQADALASSMGMVLPIASYMEVSFDQVGAAIAAMTRTGTSAQTASMQLRQILNALVKPTQQSEEALRDMKTSAAELRRTIREDGLLAALMKINELTKKYGEDTVATVFPNIRALSGMLDIMGKNLGDNIKIFDSLADSTGFLDTAFGEVAQTTEFKWNRAIGRLKTSLTEMGRTVADVIIPMMEGLAERVRRITEWFENLSDANKKLVVRITALIAIVGPLSILLGTLVGSVFPALIRVGMGAVKMFNMLRLAVMTNPFTAIMYAVMAVATALAIFAKRAKEARTEQKKLSEVMATAMKNTSRQRIETEKLFEIAKDETRSIKQREAAVRELNKRNKELLGHLTLENIATQEGIKAHRLYVEELLREAQVKAGIAKLATLEEEYKKLMEGQTKVKFTFGDYIKGVLAYAKAQIPMIKNLKDAGKGHELLIQQIKQYVDVGNVMTKQHAERFVELANAITEDKKAVKALVEELMKVEDFGDVELDLTVTPTGGGGGRLPPFLKEIAAINREVEEQEQMLNTLVQVYKTLGMEFDEAAERVNIYTNALQKLAHLGLAPTHEEILKMARSLEKWSDLASETHKIMKEFGEGLVQLEIKSRISGDSIELLEERIDLYKDTIDALIAEGDVDFAASLEEDVEKMEKTLDSLKKERFGETVYSIAQSFQALGNAIAQAAEDSKVNFAEAMNVIMQTALSTLGVLQALAAANIITKETQKGLVGVFTAIAGLALLAGVWATFVKKPAKMAGGGTVPPGYPNDTFPALLTSGERVTPAGAPPERQRVEVKGRLETDGTKIYWVLEEVKEQMSRVTG